MTCRAIFGPLDSWDDGFLRAGGSDEEGTIFGRGDGSDPAGSRCLAPIYDRHVRSKWGLLQCVVPVFAILPAPTLYLFRVDRTIR